jgi:hypothetical protein
VVHQSEAARCATAVIVSHGACRGLVRGVAVLEDLYPVRWIGQQAVVLRAFQRAVISGTQLRLVVTAPHVSRVLSLSGVDRLVPIYPSLGAVMAASAPAGVLAVVARPGLGGSRLRGGSTVGYGR